MRELPHIHPLHLADKHFDKPGAIDLLLGQDVWNDLFLAERITGAPNTPTALHTVFGWTIGGPYSSQQPSQAITANSLANIIDLVCALMRSLFQSLSMYSIHLTNIFY